ncbi:MAG TPA: 2OG-Fe(II) oxygenase [Gammaproteobacteria bacterium]|nr:2OG-Fe(II) oxygenase [Gammaproteobacteria bacterium]
MHNGSHDLQQAEALLAAHAYGSPEFERGLTLLRQAASAGQPEAQLSLGDVYSQMHQLPDAAQQAAAWYTRAVEGGAAPALTRLADLYMLGWGVSQDDSKAFGLYRRLAELGLGLPQCDLAYMLGEGVGCTPDAAQAVVWYLRAAAQGEPRAYFNLGLAFRQGRGTAPDPVHAWAWMENARRQAYPCAEAELAAMTQTLSPQQSAPARALADAIDRNFQDLQATLQQDPSVLGSAERYRTVVERNFAGLGIAAFSLDAGPRPHGATGTPHVSAAPVRISERPHVFTVDEFVSRGECAHLMTLANRNFRPAKDLTADRLSQENLHFTGNMAALQLDLCDPVVRTVERRVGAAFGLPASHVEPLSVLRYRGGNRYAAHVDYFDAARLAENRARGDRSGQRVASFLVYLQPAEAGGETHYLKLGKKVQGRERMALCHFNCLPSGEPDPATLHTGEPVHAGEKWLARTTVRERPFY